MLTLFKSKKGKTKQVVLTPSIANKIAKNVIINDITIENILMDIDLRSHRGYTWTFMLQVDMDTIIELESLGWKIQKSGFNKTSNRYMIKISW